MSKLTDAQLVLLSKASQREDRSVELPPSPGGRTVAMIKLLLQRGLLAEVPTEPPMTIYRRDAATNAPISLVISELGLVAIGVTADLDEEPKTTSRRAKAKTKAAKSSRSPRKKVQAKTKKPTKPAAPPAGKSALVLKLLVRKEGASIEALTKATGWLPHSTRAALTGLRKKGFAITRGKAKDDTTIYRVSTVAA